MELKDPQDARSGRQPRFHPIRPLRHERRRLASDQRVLRAQARPLLASPEDRVRLRRGSLPEHRGGMIDNIDMMII